MRAGSDDMPIWWFNLDALAQKNGYKPQNSQEIVVYYTRIELTTSRLIPVTPLNQ